MGVQEEKERRDDQDLGKAILALAELKVTESTSIGTNQENEIENLEKAVKIISFRKVSPCDFLYKIAPTC